MLFAKITETLAEKNGNSSQSCLLEIFQVFCSQKKGNADVNTLHSIQIENIKAALHCHTARKSTMVNGREPAKFHDVAFKTLAIIKYCFVDKIMIVDQWKPTLWADGNQDQWNFRKIHFRKN